MIRMDTFPYCLWEYWRENTVMRMCCECVTYFTFAENMSWCKESIWNRKQNHLVLNVNMNYVQNG